MKKTNWYKNSLIYQIYPLSFYDSNDDGYGDIKGIIDKFSYIIELGVDTIRLSSIFDDVNGFSINPLLGTIDDLKELINKCHKNDLKVILDVPTLDKFEKIKEAILYFINFKVDGFIFYNESNKKLKNIFNELKEIINKNNLFIAVDSYKKKCFKNEYVDAIIDYSIFKSDTKFNNQFLKKKFNLIQFKNGLFKNQIKYFKKYRYALILEGPNFKRSNSRFNINYHDYWYEATTMLPFITYFTSGIPFVYQGQEIGIINTPFTRIEELKDPQSINTYNKLLKIFKSKKAFEIVKYGASDHAKTPMQWDQSTNAGFSDNTPWMMVNPTYPLINVYIDQNIDNSIFYFYKDLFRIRKSYDVFLNGKIKEYSHLNKHVVVYKRYDKDELLVISNFSDKPYKYKLPKELKGKKLSIIFSNYQENEIKDNIISLKPYEAILFKID